MNYLSKRVQSIKPSPTLAVTALAAELRAQGKDVISLSSGEPDFDTPEHIKKAAIDALNAGKTKYTAVDGIVELREAICQKLNRENGLDYETNEIVVSTGAKQCIYNLMQAVVNEGDEVIIPAPYWVSYPDMALLSGGVPCFIRTDISQNYKINAKQLKASLTNRTKLILLNSPSNPSGSVYSYDELVELAKVLEDYPRVLICSDDIYEHVRLTDYEFFNIANIGESMKKRTLVVNGVSKCFAMTGWRIGYIAGDAEIIKAVKKIQSQSTSNTNSIAQWAAVAALNGGLDCIKPMVEAFKQRHDFVVSALNSVDGILCNPAEGAFYAFAEVKGMMKRLGVKNDVEFANRLLEAGVAVVPGSAFGLEGYMRLSFATSMENLEKAMERIAKI